MGWQYNLIAAILTVGFIFFVLVIIGDINYKPFKPYTGYTEKCIHGHIILVGHSGGIAGPLGECK